MPPKPPRGLWEFFSSCRCPLNETHLICLTSAFATDGVVDDRRTPIRLLAPKGGLDPKLVKSMKTVNLMDPNSPIPTLKLIREHPEVEERLERELFALADDDEDRLLSDNEVAERQLELDGMRKGQDLATLLNGNHRINAMIAACQPLADAALHIATCERNKVEGFDPAAEWRQLTDLPKKATYVVEVYHHDAPSHVKAWLAENERARPQYAPLAGEAVWSLVESQETFATRMVEEGKATDREDAIEQINALRSLQHMKKTSDARRFRANQSTCQVANESPRNMVYTRLVLDVYNERINNTHAKVVVIDQGAAFATHAWLGMHLLLQVSLTDAENLIASVNIEAIDSKGREDARIHFFNLTSKPQDIQALLPLWEPDGHAVFEDTAATHIYGTSLSLCKPGYSDPTFITALRRTYFEFGKLMTGNSKNEAHMYTMEAVYTRLYDYCFPLYFKEEMHLLYNKKKQRDSSIQDYFAELAKLRRRLREITDRQHVLRAWDGAARYIKVGWALKGIQAETTDINTLHEVLSVLTGLNTRLSDQIATSGGSLEFRLADHTN
ncbi:hypothetical protein FRC11_000697 [Ceratobasidium sp. 423]|nr:hypothetical protein FRC11_000697 [Ceratobasidium sp. 423]